MSKAEKQRIKVLSVVIEKVFKALKNEEVTKTDIAMYLEKAFFLLMCGRDEMVTDMEI